MKNEICGNCKWWMEIGTTESGHICSCFRYPTTQIKESFDFCGEFESNGKIIRCLSCGKLIDKGNYCEEHRWEDNAFLPKPNDGETVTKGG